MTDARPDPPAPPAVVSTATVGAVRHDEKLWPAAWVWVVFLVFAAVLGVAVLPAAGATAALVTGGVSAVGVVALMLWWATPVRVVEIVRSPAGAVAPADDPPAGPRDEPSAELWLQAGDARIPVSALGQAVGFRGDEWRRQLGPELDARSHRCIRGWIPHGIRVDVTDPRDPVPYWLVSTRRPEGLARALGADGPPAERPAGGDGGA